jgi:hypothetical protein
MPSQHRRLLAVPAALLLALALAGCGGEKDSANDTPSTVLPGSDPSQNADVGLRYFTAVASNDPETIGDAFDLAAPGSQALKYLGDVRSDANSGATMPAGTLAKTDAGYRVCVKPGSCHKYGGIILADGKVSTFTVDGKQLK